MPFEPGRSGNPAGGPVGSRHRQQLNGEFIAALLRDFRHGGPKAIERVRRTQPAAYLKILTLLCPREHKVEHRNLIKELTDEQLEAAIEYIEAALAAKAGDQAKVIEGIVEPTALHPLSLNPSASVQTGCSSTPIARSGRKSASRGSAGRRLLAPDLTMSGRDTRRVGSSDRTVRSGSPMAKT